MMNSFSTFTSLLENCWLDDSYNGNPSQPDFNTFPNQQQIRDISSFTPNYTGSDHNLLLQQPLESSSSCSPSSVFNLDQSQLQPFFPPRPCFSSVLNIINNNPFDNSFDLRGDMGFLPSLHVNQASSDIPSIIDSNGGAFTGFEASSSNAQMGTPDFSSMSQFHNTHFLHLPDNNGTGLTNSFGPNGFENLEDNERKMLKPLEIFPCSGAQPTLFQKRKNRENGHLSSSVGKGKREVEEEMEKRMKNEEEDEVDEVSADGSGLNYDSDEGMDNDRMLEENVKNGLNNSNTNSMVANGDQKGKKKGLPAKNLMAERRRRKKLNDRLYMLRSVVPKISKMDRASILGDAIEYLKELLQRINDLHNELESSPNSSLPLSASFQPLTPTSTTLPSHIKEELCHSVLPSPNHQPAKVEVRLREGRAVNIHMFCARRPGLLLSTMKALDDLGLDVQQAVISCFDGFALDVFRAEQCMDGPDIMPEAIKTVLLNSASFHGVM